MTQNISIAQPQIEISHLYGGYNHELVLEDINLLIQDNDFIGLIGPNGGGKTTLLKMILGLLTPRSGQIYILGKPPRQGRQYLGYVPQFTVFDSDFPINTYDVVKMGRLSDKRVFKSLTSQDDEIIEEKLAWVDMLDHKNTAIQELSGGQRRRVYIARALATEPKVLLLDEPTISVDLESRTKIYELLHNINLQGVTILLVSHDLNVISSYVKTIGCLNRQLHYHGEKVITEDMLKAGYNCPVDLIAHGLPHRVLADHQEGR